MLWLSIALVVVAGLAHDAFRRWLDRERGEWRASIEEQVNAASRRAREAGEAWYTLDVPITKLTERVGILEKLIVAKRGA